MHTQSNRVLQRTAPQPLKYPLQHLHDPLSGMPVPQEQCLTTTWLSLA